MNQIIIIYFLLFMVTLANAEKRMVEITFNDLTQLQRLVEMDIDLDHHRTLTEVHAFVTDEEFQIISQMDFDIREIPNKAKLYFEELRQNTMDSRNPMEDYHNYIELTKGNFHYALFRIGKCHHKKKKIYDYNRFHVSIILLVKKIYVFPKRNQFQ